MNAEHPLPPKQKAAVRLSPTAKAPQNAEKPIAQKKPGFFARLFGRKGKDAKKK